MKNKLPIAIFAFIIILFFIAFFLTKETGVQNPTSGEPLSNITQPEKESTTTPTPNLQGNDEILKNAFNLYIQKKSQGVDMSSGPCLGTIGKDWVLDIAHNPRQPVDDEPQNQCVDFREGRAHHFIELDINGKLIRVH